MADKELSLGATLGLNGQPFEHGISKATNFAREQFKALVGYFSAQFTAESVVESFRKSLDFANAMRDNSEATGVGVEQLQAWNYAAQQSGAGAEKLQLGLRKVLATQADVRSAAEGSDKLVAAYQALGVSERDIVTQSPDRILELIGRKLASGTDEASSFAAAMAIFGERVGPNFLQALREIGSQGLDSAVQKLRGSGALMNEELTKQLDQAKKNLELLEQKKTIFFGQGLGGMMDFVHLLQVKTGLVNGDEGWLKEIREKNASEANFNNRVAGRADELRKNQLVIGGQPVTLSEDTIRAEAERQIRAEDAAAAAKKKREEEANKVTEAAANRDAKVRDQAAAAEAQAAQIREATRTKELSLLVQIAAAHAAIQSLEQKRNDTEVQMGADYELLLSQLDLEKAKQEQVLADAEKRSEQIKANAAKRMEDIANQGAGPITAADRLAKIGGYVGGQTDPLIRMAERQAKIAEEQLGVLREMNEKLGGKAEGGVTE